MYVNWTGFRAMDGRGAPAGGSRVSLTLEHECPQNENFWCIARHHNEKNAVPRPGQRRPAVPSTSPRIFLAYAAPLTA